MVFFTANPVIFLLQIHVFVFLHSQIFFIAEPGVFTADLGVLYLQSPDVFYCRARRFLLQSGDFYCRAWYFLLQIMVTAKSGVFF